MLNRAAVFATIVAGAGLSVAALLGPAESVEAAPQPQPQLVEVLDHQPIGWHLVHQGDQARLAYGIADSDQILVMFSCAAGDQQVHVFGQAAPETRSVRLTSASLTSDIAVVTEMDPLSGVPVIEAEIPLRSAALRGFRENGRLTLTAGDGRAILAHAMQAELASVQVFFEHCERRSI
ncbi:MAG: hypothetical protein J0L52_03505 [Caulobacterales bacterium]|nr:hypothetical protein [Caulobacterales bacterium]